MWRTVALLRCGGAATTLCDYCDCRDLAPIRELSDEHDRIGALMGQVRDRLAAGADTDAAAALTGLQAALGHHLVKEEAGLFAQLSATADNASYLEGLASDHARARAGLLAVDAGSTGWAPGVLAAFDELAEHISVEEYDLFPASRMIIDDAGWAEITAAHQRSNNPAGVSSHSDARRRH